MTNKKSSANLAANVVENAANVSTDSAAGAVVTPKVTTFEELWKGHETLPTTEDGYIILTDELFRNGAAGHRYAYKAGEQLHKWTIQEKQSGVKDKGGKTIYAGIFDGEKFEGWSIEDIKMAAGCDYRRAKDGSNNSKSPLAKMQYRLLSKDFAGLVEEIANEEVKKAFDQLRGIVGILRAEEVKREEEQRAQTAAAEKEQKKLDTIKKLLADLTPEQKMLLGI